MADGEIAAQRKEMISADILGCGEGDEEAVKAGTTW